MLTNLATLGTELFRGTLQLLYPALCQCCGIELSNSAEQFCPTCRAELTKDQAESCPHCAATVGPFQSLTSECLACRGEHFAFAGVSRFGVYEDRIRDVVLQLKNHSGEVLAERLGELWGGHAGGRLLAFGPSAVVPVPLHHWRRWRRGYNQSEALARGLAATIRLPCRSSWLRRVRATPPQHVQAAGVRKTAMKGAFVASIPPSARGSTVLLVDDVLTTGATASDAARALKVAGAGTVLVAVLARAGGKG